MMSPSILLRTSALLLCLLPVGCEPDSELVERLGKLEEDSARFKREAEASRKQSEIWKSELDKLRAEKSKVSTALTPTPAVSAAPSSRETEQLISAVRDELRAFREEIKGVKTSMEKIERIKWPEERPAAAETTTRPTTAPTPPPSRPRPAVPGDVNEIRWPEEQGSGNSARPTPAPAPGPRPTPPPRQLQPPGEGGPPPGGDAPIEIRWPEER